MADDDDQVSAELALLQSIYPSETSWNSAHSELSFRSIATEGASCTLRIPENYIASDQLPVVLDARASDAADLSQALRDAIAALPRGEQVLDLAVARFEELAAASAEVSVDKSRQRNAAPPASTAEDARCTILVWLHHLLNTNKRKQVLAPQGEGVAGVSKPGYPGVLIFSGPAQAVRQHVTELKQLNWAAFQVRLEEESAWPFAHGEGVREVEAMGEVVKEIAEGKKDVFLEAMKMKG